MKRPCIACGSADLRSAFDEFGVVILRCAECGHLRSTFDAVQYYDGYFGSEPLDSADLFWWNEAHARMYDAFCGRFIAGRSGKLLDVGCGLGFFVQRMNAFPAWETVGYEISADAVAYARTTLGLPNVFAGRLEDSGIAAKSVDIITLWDVIEHIPDPDPLLSHLASLLTDRGMLFMHTPNAAIQLPKAKLKRLAMGMRPGVHYLEARDHINIYSMRSLATVLKRHGFTRVRFTHLPPIQSVAGAKSAALRAIKNTWFGSAALLHRASFGAINLDNLFVAAQR